MRCTLFPLMLGITYLLFFESVEFDYVYNVNDFNKEKFIVFMGQFSSKKLRKGIMSKGSLRDYVTFYRHKG
jgi:hypothetical protein